MSTIRAFPRSFLIANVREIFERMGESRYLVFLLLMAGFWTSFNQIFMTLPD